MVTNSLLPTSQLTWLQPIYAKREVASTYLFAIAILAANGNISNTLLSRFMLVGELSLDGTLQPIKGALPIAIKARAEGYQGLIVPQANVREAAVVNKLEVYGMENIIDVIHFLEQKTNPTTHHHRHTKRVLRTAIQLRP